MALGLAACQYVAELDEDRSVQSDATGGSAADGGAASGGTTNDGVAGAAGAAPAAGGNPSGNPAPKCRIEAARQASHLGSGNPALAFVGDRWGLGRPYFANGVAYSNLDEHGILQGEEDAQPILPQDGWSNDNVSLVPFKGDFLLGVSRRHDTEPGPKNIPTVVRISPDDGTVVKTATAPSFSSSFTFEVASMAVATQEAQSTTLMVMHPLGEVATAELRRFDDQLESFGEGTIANTWDAAAAWSQELDRFGVFVLKKATPKQLWLHSYTTDGALDNPIQTRIDQGDEVPELSRGLYSLSATASPNHFFLAWTDERVVNQPRVYLTRVDQDGARPEDGPASVWVSESHPDKEQTSPMVVYDGLNLAVVWRSEPHAYFRRFTTDLEPLGDEYEITSTLSDAVQDRPILAASGPNSYGIAYIRASGEGYFVFHRVVCDGP
jgi:hypothetical protein